MIGTAIPFCTTHFSRADQRTSVTQEAELKLWGSFSACCGPAPERAKYTAGNRQGTLTNWLAPTGCASDPSTRDCDNYGSETIEGGSLD